MGTRETEKKIGKVLGKEFTKADLISFAIFFNVNSFKFNNTIEAFNEWYAKNNF